MNRLTKWGIAILGVPLALGVVGNMLPDGDVRTTETRPTWTSTPMATATEAPTVVVVEMATAEPTSAPAAATAVPVADTPTAAADTSARTNVTANLRAGPGTDFAVVGSTQEGEAVDIVGRTEAGDWYQLANGAWVAAALVSNAPDVGVAAVIPPLPVQAVVEATPTSAPDVVQPTVASNPQAFTCAGGCATPPDASCAIKGNVNSQGERIYHVPGGQSYNRTDIKPEEGDRWFCTSAEAQSAGFRAAER